MLAQDADPLVSVESYRTFDSPSADRRAFSAVIRSFWPYVRRADGLRVLDRDGLGALVVVRGRGVADRVGRVVGDTDTDGAGGVCVTTG